MSTIEQFRYRWLLPIVVAFGIASGATILALWPRSEDIITDPGPRKLEAEFIGPAHRDYSGGQTFFTPDGVLLGRSGWDPVAKQGVIDFWDVKSQMLVHTVAQPAGIRGAVLAAHGKKLLTGGDDQKMRIFAGPGWELEHVFDHEPANSIPWALAIFPDGKQFLSATGKWGANARIWDFDARKSRPLPAKRDLIKLFVVSTDGTRFAVEHYDRGSAIEIWDANKLQAIGRLRNKKGAFVRLAFSPDGLWIATSMYDHGIIVWNSATFQREKELPSPIYPETLAFTNDSKLVICCTGGHAGTDGEVILNKVCVWDVSSGRLVHTFRPYESTGSSMMALSPDNRWLVTGCRLWDFEKIRREIGQ